MKGQGVSEEPKKLKRPINILSCDHFFYDGLVSGKVEHITCSIGCCFKEIPDNLIS